LIAVAVIIADASTAGSAVAAAVVAGVAVFVDGVPVAMTVGVSGRGVALGEAVMLGSLLWAAAVGRLPRQLVHNNNKIRLTNSALGFCCAGGEGCNRFTEYQLVVLTAALLPD